jgi:predicted Zn-dependent protease
MSINRFISRSHNEYTYFQPKRTITPTTTKILIGLSTFGMIYYISNQDYVPISNRRRFIGISRKFEAKLGEHAFEQTLAEYQNYILPLHHPISKLIQKITFDIVKVSNLSDLKWEVFVINSNQKNAFVLPGGKVFVFTGILECADTDDRLAAVLSHEIAHQVARHSAEGITFKAIITLITISIRLIIDPPVILTDLISKLVQLKNSREMETEADQIGLQLMAVIYC